MTDDRRETGLYESAIAPQFNRLLNGLLPGNHKMFMSSLSSPVDPVDDCQTQDFPVLASLRLVGEDLRILARQGFVSREVRHSHEYFKLRFRRNGKQRVKYVSAGQAAAVRAELNQLQAATRLNRRIAAVTRDAQQILRQTKRDLEPVLAARGFAFHGLAIRRRRTNKPNELLPTTEPTR